MGGTIEGGRKARATNYKKYGPDFYRKIGSKGGQNGNTGGFAARPELAKTAGAKGGRISRRGPAGTKKEKEYIWRPGDAMFSK
jgi:general stress protein YciG